MNATRKRWNEHVYKIDSDRLRKITKEKETIRNYQERDHPNDGHKAGYPSTESSTVITVKGVINENNRQYLKKAKEGEEEE